MYWLILAASSVLLFVAVWILVPAPNAVLLPLAVGAPEVSPVLLVLALVLVGASAWYARVLGTARLALVFSLVSSALSAWPLVQLPAAVRRFDEAMPDATGLKVEGQPVTLSAILRQPRAGDSHIVRGVEFARPNGHALKLDVYKPASGNRSPILVQVYGGAWQRGAPADNEAFARYFAGRGYVVVAVDYRHAPEWKWPAAAEDVRSALEWVVAHAAELGGDARRIALIGRSSGAHLALLAAYDRPLPAVRAIIDMYGPVDLAEGWKHPPQPDPLNVRGILETFLGGTPATVPHLYKEASPITYVRATLPPTLLIYGGRDHIVEARFGRQLDRALKTSGAISVLLEIPWSEHAFDAVPTGLGAARHALYGAVPQMGAST